MIGEARSYRPDRFMCNGRFAEVVGINELLAAGHYNQAKSEGKIRLENKDYIVQEHLNEDAFCNFEILQKNISDFFRM